MLKENLWSNCWSEWHWLSKMILETRRDDDWWCKSFLSFLFDLQGLLSSLALFLAWPRACFSQSMLKEWWLKKRVKKMTVSYSKGTTKLPEHLQCSLTYILQVSRTLLEVWKSCSFWCADDGDGEQSSKISYLFNCVEMWWLHSPSFSYSSNQSVTPRAPCIGHIVILKEITLITIEMFQRRTKDNHSE